MKRAGRRGKGATSARQFRDLTVRLRTPFLNALIDWWRGEGQSLQVTGPGYRHPPHSHIFFTLWRLFGAVLPELCNPICVGRRAGQPVPHIAIPIRRIFEHAPGGLQRSAVISGILENSENIGIRSANVVHSGFPSLFPHTLSVNENSENSLGLHRMIEIRALEASPAPGPATRLP